VYPWLGFSTFLDINSGIFDRMDTRGGYVTDRQVVNQIIALYDSHIAYEKEPLFLAGITIQNHGPYHGKYRASPNFTPQVFMADDDVNALSNYFEGVADNDAELFRLIEHFRNTDAPVVLVYYGDHLPALPLAALQALLPEAEDAPAGSFMIRFNRVPFIIWANPAGQALLNTEAFDRSLPVDRTISAHYLGAALLEMLGLTGLDPFLDYVNKLRPIFPVKLENTYRTYRTEEGFQHFSWDETAEISLYKSWAYSRIRD
jgi:hypothetical protein